MPEDGCTDPTPVYNKTGSCYWYESEARNFTSANADCERKGGTLAVVDTEDTSQFLLSHGYAALSVFILLICDIYLDKCFHL